LYFSDEDVIPNQLPEQYFIKNGLRSNYYKTTTVNKSKSIKFVLEFLFNEHKERTFVYIFSNKTHLERRRRQSSGSLPPFYTGIFESDDDKSPYIDYRLPYDIYWSDQKKSEQITEINNVSSPIISTSIFPHQKKKSSKPKQKQPSPYKKILRNVYTDQLRQNLLSSYSIEKAPVCDCKPPDTCEDGTCLNRMIFTECLPKCNCGMFSHEVHSFIKIRIVE